MLWWDIGHSTNCMHSLYYLFCWCVFHLTPASGKYQPYRAMLSIGGVLHFKAAYPHQAGKPQWGQIHTSV